MKNWLHLLCICFFIGSSSSATEIDPAKLDQIAHSRYWLNLLHFKDRWLGKPRSQVDGPGFFLAPSGRQDPKAELIATVESFSKDIRLGAFSLPPQCAFPERYHFLKKELGLRIQDIPCPKVDEFLARFNAKSATLLYASAYPNNPGSMFGHTYLRINSKAPGADQKKLDILDYGINFAAAVRPDENGFAFVWFGLTGGYVGELAMIPYYVKVKEYSDSESRDIWEYDLNLNEEETTRMLRHVWELQTNGYFNYYFFDINCSYILLTLLEVAKPQWELSDFGIYVIPAETIKKVAGIPGAITGVKLRPSLRRKMLAQYEGLNSKDRQILSRLISGEMEPAATDSAPALESLISYLSYVKQKKDGKLGSEEGDLFRKTLVRRSELGVSKSSDSPFSGYSLRARPDMAHHPYRLGTSSGAINGVFFQDFDFKVALHDLLNSDTGYIRFSQIDFPELTLRYEPGNSYFGIERFNGLTITSLFPMTVLEKRPSWKLALDYYSPKDFACEHCHLARLEAGAGASVEAFTPDAVAYIMGSGAFELGSALPKGYRWGPKLQIGSVMNPFEKYKSRLAATGASDLGQTDRQNFYYQLEWEQSFSIDQAWDIRTSYFYWLRTQDSAQNSNEMKISLNHYF